MKLLSFGITEDLAKQILQGFLEGQYQLLCGAGVSFGAIGGDGNALKMGKEEAHGIISATSTQVDPSEIDNLSIVYEEAKAQNKTKLHHYIKEHFIKSTPTWQSILFDLSWNRIWTLNIDDVLENSFKDSNRAGYKKLTSISWQERLMPPDRSQYEIQVVHLHGIASRVGMPGEDLIFGIDEYAKVVRTVPPWHAAFESAYVQDPFVICGARLSEEPDFALATRTMNQSMKTTGFPSLIVLKDFSESQHRRLVRFGLTPVAATGEEFFSALIQDLEQYKKTHVINSLQSGILERFSGQFRKLDPRNTTQNLNTDFYGGDEPTWPDIVNNKDTIFHQADQIISGIKKQKVASVYVLHGSLGTGKTAALLRVGKEVIGLGYVAYLFRNEEALDIEACLNFLSSGPKAALLFDDAADYSAGIGKLVKRCDESGIPCVIIATERTRRLRAFRLDIADKYRKEYVFGYMHDKDIWGLIRHRRNVARLGSLIRKKDKDVFKFFSIDCHRELLEALSQAEFAKGFKSRISDYIDAELVDPATRSLSTVIACVHRFGHLLPLTLGMKAAGMEFSKFQGLLESSIGTDGIIVREPRGLRLRHRIISEQVWKQQDEAAKHSAMILICESLAPLINPSTIRAKMLPHRIVREILDVDEVQRSIGIRAFEFYQQLEPLYGWSSRFWDQRALLESNIDNFPKAYSFSQKAVSLEKHPFAYNTLGAICLRQANYLAHSEPKSSQELFSEGIEALDQARIAAERIDLSFEHPFVCFFSNAIKYAKNFINDDIAFGFVKQHWHRWINVADKATCFRTGYGQQRISSIKADWMKIEISRKR